MNDVHSDKVEFSSRDWPDWRLGDREEAVRRGQRRSVFGAAIFLVFLVPLIVETFQGDASALTKSLLLVAVLAYAGVYPVVLAIGPQASRRNRVLLVVAMFALGLVVVVLSANLDSLVYLSYSIVAALMLLPLRWGRILGLGVAAAQIILEWLVRHSVNWDNVVTLALLTLGMGAFLRLLNTIGLLRQAREDVANLAVAEERSRMARDLHDVLGHSLTSITLKTGLARRILENGLDREQAVAELREAEDLSRQALTEIRATISGYRKASLAAEIVGARVALRTAEITADLPRAVDDVRTDLQEPFAYVLREGITNVIRHSAATRCQVRLGHTWLEIADNGTGPQPDGHGNGLAGLAERLHKVGGTLRAEPGPDGGFRLLATVPAETPAKEPAEPVEAS